jgi:hypothetical protein
LRPFAADDIPQVARLHQQVFETGNDARSTAYDSYLTGTFLPGPRRVSGIESLVSEENGRITGFLGIIPFKAAVNERPVWIAVCTQFCVDPESRGMTGIKLIRRALEGPQDISLTDEANERTVKLWKWAGGDLVLGSSLHWIRPLRPARMALSWLRDRPGGRLAAVAASPAAALVDHILARLPRNFPKPSSDTRLEDLPPARIIEGLPLVTRGRALSPVYEADSLGWYLARASAASNRGPLRTALVSGPKETAGWFMYHAKSGGIGEVLQVAAAPGAVETVLDHLLFDAWSHGLFALSGRADPPALQSYSDRHCYFTRRGPSTLVYARERVLLEPFHRGEAFFSRLDGEWCARFR